MISRNSTGRIKCHHVTAHPRKTPQKLQPPSPNRRHRKPKRAAGALPNGSDGGNPRSIPDPFGIASDNLAGVRLSESKRDRRMAIQFGQGRPEDKPSQDVLDTMKGAGYRWNPSERMWTHPVHPESAMTTRIEAERLYEDVCQMIRQEKGIETGPAISR